MQGWVKLHRSLQSSAIANHPEYLAVWVHLLMRASHKPREAIVGRSVVPLNSGDVVFGRKKFSAETGVSENKVRAALDVLKRLNQITIKSHAKFSVISITKWSEYQTSSPANDHDSASNAPAPSQHPATDKNGNNGENGKNIPVNEIVDLFNRSFPELPQVQKVTPARSKAVKARWAEHKTMQCVERWEAFFGHIRKSDFLMGRTYNPWSGLGFDWIMKSGNFLKIIEGNYHNAN